MTLKTINQELEKRGVKARLKKGPSYLYFSDGETEDWLDRTVAVPSLSHLTLEQWLHEFERLKKLNQDILRSPRQKEAPPTAVEPPSKRKHTKS